MNNDFIKILDLAEKFEADFLEEILNDHKILFRIIPYEDSVFNHALPNSYKNWGWLEAPKEQKEQVIQLYNEFKNSTITQD